MGLRTAHIDPELAATTLIAEHDDDPWLDAFVTTLEDLRSARQLMRLQTRSGLTLAELGACFGVSRQAVSKWIMGASRQSGRMRSPRSRQRRIC